MIYLTLFWSFFQIGLFSIGGGFAAMPLIQAQVVDTHQWLTLAQFSDLVTIAEMTPGPISLNAATFVGTQVAGLPGAIIATLGCILPSCIIVFTLAWLYHKYKELNAIQGILSGLRPAVVALISSAGLTLLILAFWGENGFSFDIHSLNFVAVVLFFIAFIALKLWKPNPVLIMLGCGIIGGLIYSLSPLQPA